MKNNSRILQVSILLLLIFNTSLIATSKSTAQNNTEDVIYLKNGGILRGEILEIKNGETVKIETAGRNVFVVHMNQIDQIIEQEIPVSRFYKTSGFINHSGFDLLAGPDTTTPSFYTMNGYQFSPRFSAGIGIGFISYRDPLDLLPVYVQLNVNLIEANTIPFLFLKAGYNFSIASENIHLIEDHSGGSMLNPGMGIQFNLSSGFRWYLNVGYNVNNAVYEEEDFNQTIIENDLSYRRVNFGIGFSF